MEEIDLAQHSQVLQKLSNVWHHLEAVVELLVLLDLPNHFSGHPPFLKIDQVPHVVCIFIEGRQPRQIDALKEKR